MLRLAIQHRIFICAARQEPAARHHLTAPYHFAHTRAFPSAPALCRIARPVLTRSSAFHRRDFLFVANRRNHAAKQFRRHPRYVVFSLRMARRANNHFIVVDPVRDELASRNHIAAMQKFFHGRSPAGLSSRPEGGATAYKLYTGFPRFPENSSAVNTVESLRLRRATLGISAEYLQQCPVPGSFPQAVSATARSVPHDFHLGTNALLASGISPMSAISRFCY